ncbi:hypothetical protein BD410DRAFT_835987 [Rickenella mellea]|uniref:Xylanolytic transcriptional activator regulatory domain-containing protein n=1 Tax=Rickenella mellea TaxID=50990 RepID=A0A4Y7QJ66_9AGAM|nr:hypothetical protein BD410DRAFT_835987 [Rickenella mellea]
MPVDTSGKGRHMSRRMGTASEDRHREQELKRARGEIACAECNRLKLRCDKKLPLSFIYLGHLRALNWTPGSLPSGQGNRYVLADTEQLHRKLLDMSERIRQLEDALEIQFAHSPVPHPLLREELLAVKRIELNEPVERGQSPKEHDALEDFGTLTVSDQGVSRFIGRTGGAESLLMAELDIEGDGLDTPSEAKDRSPHDGLADRSIRWPFKAVGITTEDHLARIEAQLPPWERAWGLCETYLEQSSWHLRLVKRPQLMDELLTPIYKRRAARLSMTAIEASMQNLEMNNAHDLGLLLMVFAMAALVDLALRPFNEEAAHYYTLARTVVTLESAAESPSLAVVQILTLMTTYCELSDSIQTMERAFSTSNFASILGATIGLHRDPARWALEDKMIQRRRDVFWQLFTVQNWQGLASGRPMMFTLRSADCEFPVDDEETIDENGTVQMGCRRWMYRFARDILYDVNKLSCSVGPIKYSEILELDRKVRETVIPKKLQIPPAGSDWENDGPCVILERLLPILWVDTTMLYIHRSYFAKALLDHPTDPLKSPYASSFLSACRSSLSLLKIAREHYEVSPNYMVRSWMLWKHMFSALVVVGTIVIRGPSSNMAPSALAELTSGVELFEKASQHAEWAKRTHSVLISLRDKAVNAYSQYRSGDSAIGRNPVTLRIPSTSSTDAWVDELAIFGGQTRFMTRKTPSPHTPSSETSFTSTPSPSSSKVASPHFPLHATQSSPVDAYPTPPFSSSRLSEEFLQPPVPTNEEELAAFLAVHRTPHSPPLFSAGHQDPKHMPLIGRSEPVMEYGAGPSTHGAQPLDVPPMFYSQGVNIPPHPEEAIAIEMGLTVPRMDSEMDETWTSFLRHSGLTMPPNVPPSN